MAQETATNNAVNKAYKGLMDIAKLDIMITSNYASTIISMIDFKNLNTNIDEVINRIFWKFTDELSKHIANDDIEFITYKSFCLNEPSDELINDCFNIVNNIITNKKSSNETTLYTLLDSLKEKHSQKEIEKSLDTIFDILLDYYSIIRK